MLAWRLLFFKVMHLESLASNFRQRVLFVGWGKEAEQLEREIRNEQFSHPYEIIGCVPSPQGRPVRAVADGSVLGRLPTFGRHFGTTRRGHRHSGGSLL